MPRRFFFSVLLIQLATIGLFYAALQAGLDNRQLILTIGLVELLFTLLAALWLSSLARQCHQEQVEALREAHARERETIRIQAERQKNRYASRKEKELRASQRRIEARASFKTGAFFAGALLFGAVMLYTQLVTFGLLVLSTTGGALAGYLLRARQENSRQPLALATEKNKNQKPPARKA